MVVKHTRIESAKRWLRRDLQIFLFTVIPRRVALDLRQDLTASSGPDQRISHVVPVLRVLPLYPAADARIVRWAGRPSF